MAWSVYRGSWTLCSSWRWYSELSKRPCEEAMGPSAPIDKRNRALPRLRRTPRTRSPDLDTGGNAVFRGQRPRHTRRIVGQADSSSGIHDDDSSMAVQSRLQVVQCALRGLL